MFQVFCSAPNATEIFWKLVLYFLVQGLSMPSLFFAINITIVSDATILSVPNDRNLYS